MSSTDIESVTVEPTAPPKLHLSFVSGLLMGAADSVPGVSGGTIALIVGVYERFIEALGTMIRSPALLRTAQGRTQIVGALWLLVPLGLGLLIAYAVGTRVLVGPKDEPGLLLRPETAPYCYAFFFGLVLVSLFEVWKRIRVAAKTHWVLALVGLGAAWLFTGLPHAATEPPVWTLLFGAAAALAVMLLPRRVGFDDARDPRAVHGGGRCGPRPERRGDRRVRRGSVPGRRVVRAAVALPFAGGTTTAPWPS